MADALLELGVLDFLRATFKVGGLTIDWGGRGAMAAGLAVHRTLATRRPPGYRCEVPIQLVAEHRNLRVKVNGRLDGLLIGEEHVWVEELKSTMLPLAELTPAGAPWHLAQLQLYHHALCQRYPDRTVLPTLTYIHPETLEERAFEFSWTPDESAAFFQALAERLLTEEAERRAWSLCRDASLAALPFPFPAPRPGQPQLMQAVEAAIRRQTDLLLEAPTGLGKTLGVLFPALQHLPHAGGYRRIFFLTAKSAGVSVVAQALDHLREGGMRLRVLLLQAKERSCPLAGPDQPACCEDECPYAAHFYPKLQLLLPELLTHDVWSPELLRKIADADELCPYELALELTTWADLVVCDYNYAFDPGVMLRQYFSAFAPPDSLLLVDEAHNLVTRGRTMYSATLRESTLQALATLAGPTDPLTEAVALVAPCWTTWRELLRQDGAPAARLERMPADLSVYLTAVLEAAGRLVSRWPAGVRRRQTLDLVDEVFGFARILGLLSSEHAIYVQGDGAGLRLCLQCLHPGPHLRARLERALATVCFSATLSPARYFRELLGLRDGAQTVALPSPFPQDNRLLLHVPDVSTKLAKRSATTPTVAGILQTLLATRPGNYLAFFPSFSYLSAVWAELMARRLPDVRLLTQRPGLTSAQQVEFLAPFSAPPARGSLLGLAVMGGLFGEGIDLPGEQLIGALIAGPALPAITPETELIREYFDLRSEEGYYFAYLVPGIVRVIQAAGRVWRTPEDRGVVILLDDRFLDPPFRELLPAEWDAEGEEFSTAALQERLEEFWGG
jgi:DNA excision repair protein ERCC-2